jgi:creatinine amidohydrolase
LTSGLALLRERCDRIIPALVSALRAPRVEPLPGPWPLVTTGIGGSEGPARLLASLLQERGVAARFAPLSSFLEGPPAGRSLVLFSQGLSPNARLALAHHERYERALLATGLDSTHPTLATLVSRGLAVLPLPAEDEGGLLVRLVGPALASLAAMRLAGAVLPSTERIVAALEAAAGRARSLGVLPPGPLALVSSGAPTERCEGLRWRLLEGLLRPAVSLWDVLSVAHGPFQGFHGDEQTLVLLETPGQGALGDRLEAMLRPGRHRLLRLASTLEEPWCLLEHLVQVDALMLATLEETPHPLSPWPGQGEDGPLYEVGRHPLR